MPRVRIGIIRNKRTRWTAWVPKLAFGCVHIIWVHSGPFGCLTKLGAKWAKQLQKFVPRSRFGIFHNDLTRSTPLDPKLMFWCVSYYLGAFGTVWLPCETRCKTGRTRANVRATPLDHKLTFWCVSYYYFGAFGTVWLPYGTRCTTGRTSAKGHATKLCQNFSQRTQPIHPIGP